MRRQHQETVEGDVRRGGEVAPEKRGGRVVVRGSTEQSRRWVVSA